MSGNALAPTTGLLAELPPPPAGRIGWPWTEQTPPMPARPGSDLEWPRITIVTPAYNHALWIEETIRSVLLQNYPNLEYFVMDGGSKDGTRELLEKYSPWLSGWVSESDRGQSHAINKGFERATGSIWAYLNSDDYYLPGAFQAVAEAFAGDPKLGLLHGTCVIVDEQGTALKKHLGSITRFDEVVDLWSVWWKGMHYAQPEVFWSAEAGRAIGPFREDLNFVMDHDYWIRLLRQGVRVHRIEQELTCFRKTAVQKSRHSRRVAREQLALVKPILWDRSAPIAPRKRSRLQDKWRYNRLLVEVEDSKEASESRGMRWRRLARCLASDPLVLKTPEFWKRVRRVLS